MTARHTRFRYRVLGGHVHVRVFSGPDADHLGKNGDLCFEAGDEWDTFRSCVTYGARLCPNHYQVEFMEEES
jgi:hypothetical protein